MNIKFENVWTLKNEFLHNSDLYVKLESEADKNLKEIKKIIEGETLKRYTEEEIKSLLQNSPSFIRSRRISLGTSFKNTYYPSPTSKLVGGIFSFQTQSSILILYPNYLEDYQYENCIDLKSLGVIDKIIPLNDEIIRCCSKMGELDRNFDRFINTDTSLVWLKNHFPKVYEKLKKL